MWGSNKSNAHDAQIRSMISGSRTAGMAASTCVEECQQRLQRWTMLLAASPMLSIAMIAKLMMWCRDVQQEGFTGLQGCGA